MAKVGAQRAAELTGRSKSTIQRAMNAHKLSFETDANGRRLIDVSELERVFGLSNTAPVNAPSVEHELEKAASMLETERLKMRIKILEDQIDAAQQQIADLKDQRDQWQRQASQVLITSQYSQKQAEEMREVVKEHERREEQRRQKVLEERMKRMKAQNENPQPAGEDAGSANAFNFSGLWKRAKGTAA